MTYFNANTLTLKNKFSRFSRLDIPKYPSKNKLINSRFDFLD